MSSLARCEPARFDRLFRMRPQRAALLLPVCMAPVWIAAVGSWCPKSLVGTLSGLVLVLLLGACIYTDLSWRRIPNWATYAAVAWALGLNAVAAFATAATHDWPSLQRVVAWSGAVGIGQSLAGAGVCFGIMVAIYSLGGTGAGDVKLAAAIGALVGVQHGLETLLWCFLVAGVFGVAAAIWKEGPLCVVTVLLRRVGALLCPQWVPQPVAASDTFSCPVPMAAFFAVGVCIALCGVSP
jgi:Flp pilus assembly protein protease CpaA